MHDNSFWQCGLMVRGCAGSLFTRWSCRCAGEKYPLSKSRPILDLRLALEPAADFLRRIPTTTCAELGWTLLARPHPRRTGFAGAAMSVRMNTFVAWRPPEEKTETTPEFYQAGRSFHDNYFVTLS